MKFYEESNILQVIRLRKIILVFAGIATFVLALVASLWMATRMEKPPPPGALNQIVLEGTPDGGPSELTDNTFKIFFPHGDLTKLEDVGIVSRHGDILKLNIPSGSLVRKVWSTGKGTRYDPSRSDFTNDANVLVMASDRGPVSIYRPDKGALELFHDSASYYNRGVAMSPDGRFAAVGHYTGRGKLNVTLYDLGQTDCERWTTEVDASGYHRAYLKMEFLEEEGALLVGVSERFEILSVETGNRLNTIRTVSPAQNYCRIGRKIILRQTLARKAGLYVFDLDTETFEEISGPALRNVYRVVSSPDRSRFAVLGEDLTESLAIEIYDTETLNLVKTIEPTYPFMRHRLWMKDDLPFVQWRKCRMGLPEMLLSADGRRMVTLQAFGFSESRWRRHQLESHSPIIFAATLWDID